MFSLNPNTRTVICGVEQKRSRLPSTMLRVRSTSSIQYFWGNSVINYEGVSVSRAGSLESLQFDMSYKIVADYEFVGRLLRETTCKILDHTITIVEPPGISSEYSNLGYSEVATIRKNRAKDLLGERNLFLFNCFDMLLLGIRYVVKIPQNILNYRRGLRKI